MAFDLNALAGMDGAAEESTGGGGAGFEFPYMMWTYGDSKNAKKGGMNVGGFFIPIPVAEDRDSDEDKEKKAEAAALMAEYLPDAGWTLDTMVHQDMSETEGYYKREFAMGLINYRKRWEIGSDDTFEAFPWNWDTYNEAVGKMAAKGLNGKPRTKMHVLVAIKGAEKVGPVLLTLKGVAQINFEGTKNTPGVMGAFFKSVITTANALTKSQVPWRVFWIPAGAARDEAGKPKFEQKGKGSDTSYLVMPQLLALPDVAGVDLIQRLHVGADNQKLFESWYQDSKEWAAAWDTITPGNNGGGETNGATPEPVKADPVGAVDLASLGL